MRSGFLPLAMVALLLSIPVALHAKLAPAPLTGWEYRWGDSPLDAQGQPVWLNDTSDQWQPIDFPSNPAERNGQQHVWFRTFLPEGEWRDPVLYITSIDLIGQLYLNDELIYQYGEFDENGEGDFAGWPWHMVELPEGYAGQQLSVRVFSYYTDIGLWGEVHLTDRMGVLKQVIKDSAKDLTVSAFSLLLAMLAAIFALIGPDRRGFGAVALFASSSGLMLLAETPARQLLVEAALGWDILRAASYYMLPVAMGLLLSAWLDGAPRRWVSWLWKLHLAYLAGAIGLVFTDVISLSLTFPVFDLLLAITLPSMLVLALMRFQRLGIEQRLLVISFTLFAPLLFADMLVAHGFIAWRAIPLSYGSLGFTLAIAAVSLWHYRRTQQQLALANQTLEDKVALRTAELDHLVHKFEGLSLQDSLTGLSNRRHLDSLLEHEVQRAERQGTQLAVLMLDLDYFKRINDIFGHAAGDAVLVDIAEFLKSSFRTIDAVCRLGGEEFVVLLPGCSTSDASERVRMLMAALHEKHFHFEGKALGRITLSCGIAVYPDHARTADQLMQNADAALYQAKRAGRDRFVIWSG
ncbi:MAG: GGDEF domain-containing protein [Halomonas sp.]|nr:GGDEF domain-containing protein [Halomonas sp.]TVM04760.1 MAG: GGDEF domain-containing protein [Halomonas sp.]